MTEEQFQALDDFIQAKIENEIERAFGRDGGSEALREMHCRRDCRIAFGLPEYAQS